MAYAEQDMRDKTRARPVNGRNGTGARYVTVVLTR